MKYLRKKYFKKLVSFIIIISISVGIDNIAFFKDVLAASAPYYPINYEIKSLPSEAVDIHSVGSGRFALENKEGKSALADTNFNILFDSGYMFDSDYRNYINGGTAVLVSNDNYFTFNLDGEKIAAASLAPTIIYTKNNVVSKQFYTFENDGHENIVYNPHTVITVDGKVIFDDDCYMVGPFDGINAYVLYGNDGLYKNDIYSININGKKTLLFSYNYRLSERNTSIYPTVIGNYFFYKTYKAYNIEDNSEEYIYNLKTKDSLTCDSPKYTKNGLFCVENISKSYSIAQAKYSILCDDKYNSNVGQKSSNNTTFLFQVNSLFGTIDVLAKIEGNNVKIIKELTKYSNVSRDLSEKYIHLQRIKDKKWGYIDKNGNEIKFYDNASQFVDGLALVKDGKDIYFIDTNFKQVSQKFQADEVDEVDEVIALDKGVFKVNVGGEYKVVYAYEYDFLKEAGKYIKANLSPLYSPTIEGQIYHIYSDYYVSYDKDTRKFSKTDQNGELDIMIYLLDNEYKLVTDVAALTKATFLHNTQSTWYNYSDIYTVQVLTKLKDINKSYKEAEVYLHKLKTLSAIGKIQDFTLSLAEIFLFGDITEIGDWYADLVIKEIRDEGKDEMGKISNVDSEELLGIMHELALALNKSAVNDYEKVLKILKSRRYSEND